MPRAGSDLVRRRAHAPCRDRPNPPRSAPRRRSRGRFLAWDREALVERASDVAAVDQVLREEDPERAVRADGRAAVVAVRGRLVPEAPDAADHVLHRVLELDDQVGKPELAEAGELVVVDAREGGRFIGPRAAALWAGHEPRGHVDEVAERLEHVPARRGRDRDVDVRRGADELDHASGRCRSAGASRSIVAIAVAASWDPPRAPSLGRHPDRPAPLGVRSDRPAVRSGVDTANTVRLG